jgi:hypothetical protein
VERLLRTGFRSHRELPESRRLDGAHVRADLPILGTASAISPVPETGTSLEHFCLFGWVDPSRPSTFALLC